MFAHESAGRPALLSFYLHGSCGTVEREIVMVKIFKKREELLVTRWYCKHCKQVTDQEIIASSNTPSHIVLTIKCRNPECNLEDRILSLSIKPNKRRRT
jgi:hypothetical protein